MGHYRIIDALPIHPMLVVVIVGWGVLLKASPALCGQPSNGVEETLLPPLPRAAPSARANPNSAEKIALGEQLFFDPRLSGDNTMSCATCHSPKKAFGDGLATPKGANGKALARNSPSLLNVGFYNSFFWDGRAKTLEEQALLPIESPEEMNQNLDQLERELSAIPGYVEQFKRVFHTGVTRQGIAQALAVFQRSLVTGPSSVDRYLAGEEGALSDSAKRGLELFQGDAGCVRCHRGPTLSDGKLYRLGVSFADPGLTSVTGRKEDAGKFRTPSLRNIAETGPYMHDGSKATLFDAVEFYYRGAPARAPDGAALDIEPLSGRSYSEIADLVAFLEALSGEPPVIKPPKLSGANSSDAN